MNPVKLLLIFLIGVMIVVLCMSTLLKFVFELYSEDIQDYWELFIRHITEFGVILCYGAVVCGFMLGLIELLVRI